MSEPIPPQTPHESQYKGGTVYEFVLEAVQGEIPRLRLGRPKRVNYDETSDAAEKEDKKLPKQAE